MPWAATRKTVDDQIYESWCAFAADGLPGVIARGTRGVTPRRVLAGEGMLTPVRDTTVTYESGRSELLKAGVTRLAPDHRLVRMRPELFVLACKKDRTKARARFRHLLAVAQCRHNACRPPWSTSPLAAQASWTPAYFVAAW
jgi:hypothetical protein